MRLFLIGISFILFSCQSNSSSIAEEQLETAANDSISMPSETAKPIETALNAGIFIPSSPDYDTTQWTDILLLDSTIRLDIRYATTNNFVNVQLYDCPRCFLRPAVAQEIVKIHKELQAKGYGGLKMYDCYRPGPIQWKLWEKVPDPRYVADPRKGSQHNRGGAVDMTIVHKNGEELAMGTGYDYFGEEAYHDYTELPDSVLNNRKLLLETMEAHHFNPTSTEWWHYSYAPKQYELSDMLWKCE